ncbi:MAG: hypothetical protein LBT92_01020, partial [Rickettsiales bacterium]|nr:hypothetical protein [Rickettsiales bacterium]
DKSTLTIDGGTRTKEIYLESKMNVAGVLKTFLPDVENVLNRIKAGSLRSLSDGLKIYVENLLSIPRHVPFKASRMRFNTLSVDAQSMREALRSSEGVGIAFKTMRSATDPKYRVDLERFAGFDVIVKKLNARLSGLKIGGIDITAQTPLSVILRGLSYEYADIYRLVHNRYPTAAEAPIPGWSLGPLHRCLEEYCDPAKYPFWDSGAGD